MAEPAGSTARGTEISERSTELVLPDGPSIEASIGEEGIAVRETRAPAGARWSRRPLDDGSASRRVASEATEQTSRPVGDESRASTSSSLIERAIQRTQREEVGVNEAEGSTASGAGGRWRTHAPSARSSSAAGRDDEA
ncbi:MAG: hypothetical protein KC616_22565, partial [Myxococcales bacterium]|nr:hypothetical protein [Myxococcales bacterium]